MTATNIVIHRITDAGSRVLYHAGLPSLDAARSFLADVAHLAGADLMFEVDEEHPACADALVCGRMSAEQYSIQPDGFTVACR